MDEWDAELMSDLAHHPVPVVAVGVQLWASGSEVVGQVQLRHEMSILPMIREESLDADCAAVLEAELPAVQVFPSNFVHGLVHLQQSRGEAAGEFDLSGFDFYRPVPDRPCVLLFLSLLVCRSALLICRFELFLHDTLLDLRERLWIWRTAEVSRGLHVHIVIILACEVEAGIVYGTLADLDGVSGEEVAHDSTGDVFFFHERT